MSTRLLFIILSWWKINANQERGFGKRTVQSKLVIRWGLPRQRSAVNQIDTVHCWLPCNNEWTVLVWRCRESIMSELNSATQSEFCPRRLGLTNGRETLCYETHCSFLLLVEEVYACLYTNISTGTREVHQILTYYKLSFWHKFMSIHEAVTPRTNAWWNVEIVPACLLLKILQCTMRRGE